LENELIGKEFCELIFSGLGLDFLKSHLTLVLMDSDDLYYSPPYCSSVTCNLKAFTSTRYY